MAEQGREANRSKGGSTVGSTGLHKEGGGAALRGAAPSRRGRAVREITGEELESYARELVKAGAKDPRSYMKMLLYYTSQIVLDIDTHGKDSRDRLIRNAKLLKDMAETWCGYCGWSPVELMREVMNGRTR